MSVGCTPKEAARLWRSPAVLFTDLASAFNSALPELALGLSSRKGKSSTVWGVGCEQRARLEEWISSEETTVRRQEVAARWRRMAADFHRHPWFGVPGSQKQMHTSVGTRPGDPLADVVFAFTLRRTWKNTWHRLEPGCCFHGVLVAFSGWVTLWKRHCRTQRTWTTWWSCWRGTRTRSCLRGRRHSRRARSAWAFSSSWRLARRKRWGAGLALGSRLVRRCPALLSPNRQVALLPHGARLGEGGVLWRELIRRCGSCKRAATWGQSRRLGPAWSRSFATHALSRPGGASSACSSPGGQGLRVDTMLASSRNGLRSPDFRFSTAERCIEQTLARQCLCSPATALGHRWKSNKAVHRELRVGKLEDEVACIRLRFVARSSRFAPPYVLPMLQSGRGGPGETCHRGRHGEPVFFWHPNLTSLGHPREAPTRWEDFTKLCSGSRERIVVDLSGRS